MQYTFGRPMGCPLSLTTMVSTKATGTRSRYKESEIGRDRVRRWVPKKRPSKSARNKRRHSIVNQRNCCSRGYLHRHRPIKKVLKAFLVEEGINGKPEFESRDHQECARYSL